MATSQLHRTQGQNVSKNWAQIFPNEQVTEQKSCLFVKKLLAVAISNITYLRAIFPEHAFGDKCLEDLNLKILRDESSCPGACQVIKWVKGCFDALDKKYVRNSMDFFFSNCSFSYGHMIESYSFRFTYNSGGEVDIYRNEKKISSAYSADATKNATIRLLRTLIILTNTLTSLPENVMLTMKLFYYDDVTPSDYEPPGFRASDESEFLFEEETTKIAVGEVDTTGKDQFTVQEDANEEIEQVENPEEVSTISNEGLHQEVRSLDTKIGMTGTFLQHTFTCKNSEEVIIVNLKDTSKSATKPEVNEDDFSVRCPCGCNEDDGLMIMCSKCKFWQHGVCFLVTSESKAPSDHICDVCAKHYPDLEPTDPHLSGLTSIAIQATCLWRRALMACTEFKRIVAHQLARRLGIESTVAQGLINRLEKEGFVNSSTRGKKLGKTVDKEKITKEGIPRYLKTPKSLAKKIAEDDVEMDEAPREVSEKETASVKRTLPVDALIDKTNKIDISGHEKRKSKPSKESTQESKGRRGKKRALSKVDDSEFDVANSQEYETSRKKKASTVYKDLAV
ncbi:hypothetical protein EGW08_017515 [Elysia chlorotica]|uniref:HORMA domain-containing protein n=1 Tax=Elysia chlorotica TaxID=188477 RepID=A0A3S1B4A8_ELYCH|nr:hypothetical protein EGW08_017515 [Elysia chlorotica]